MALTPRIVRAPAGTVGFTPNARVEDVAAGEIAIGVLLRRELRRIALLATETTEAAEEVSKLRVRQSRRGEHQHNEKRQESEAPAHDGIQSRHYPPSRCYILPVDKLTCS